LGERAHLISERCSSVSSRRSFPFADFPHFRLLRTGRRVSIVPRSRDPYGAPRRFRARAGAQLLCSQTLQKIHLKTQTKRVSALDRAASNTLMCGSEHGVAILRPRRCHRPASHPATRHTFDPSICAGVPVSDSSSSQSLVAAFLATARGRLIAALTIIVLLLGIATEVVSLMSGYYNMISVRADSRAKSSTLGDLRSWDNKWAVYCNASPQTQKDFAPGLKEHFGKLPECPSSR